MRYKEIIDKEIVDVTTGTRLGILGQTDLEINKRTGKIESFVLPNYKWFGFIKEDGIHKIPWSSVQKIGKHMIMIRE
ncbi:MAG TPA: YlmC/YmxH family sporulation protein [Bacillota bacterium]|nr:YlmC/YmxH family sporulation protein [Bacillota bacterium]